MLLRRITQAVLVLKTYLTLDTSVQYRLSIRPLEAWIRLELGTLHVDDPGLE